MTTTDRSASCEDRIEGYLKRTVDEFDVYAAAQDVYDRASRQEFLKEYGEEAEGHGFDLDGDLNEQGYERASESILCVDKRITYKVMFSWGGPSDWLEVVVDPGDNTIDSITYHFADWFDHAERALTGHEFEAAKRFVESTVVFDG